MCKCFRTEDAIEMLFKKVMTCELNKCIKILNNKILVSFYQVETMIV